MGAGGMGAMILSEHHNDEIEDYLLTVIMTPREFLNNLTVTNFKISSKQSTPGATIALFEMFSTWGHHSTIISHSYINPRSPEFTLTSCLQFKDFISNPTENDNLHRIDSPQCVVQIVFYELIDMIRSCMVDPHIDIMDLERDILQKFNQAIQTGREHFKNKLITTFDKFRGLSKTNKSREKFCMLILDILRNDLLHDYGPTIQYGCLSTINIVGDDDKFLYNGKPVADPDMNSAAYNVRFLIKITMSDGNVRKIYMEIDRAKVARLLRDKSSRLPASKSQNKKSVSYWVGQVIEYIHHNKPEFFNVVCEALNHFSHGITTSTFADMIRLRDVTLPFTHYVVNLGCKSNTFIYKQDRDPSEILDLGGGPEEYKLNTSEPISLGLDNISGLNHRQQNYVSFKEISVRSNPITVAVFDVYKWQLVDPPSDRWEWVQLAEYQNYCHFPEYDSIRQDEIIKVGDGSLQSSQNSQYNPAPDSQGLRAEVNATITLEADHLTLARDILRYAMANPSTVSFNAALDKSVAGAGVGVGRSAIAPLDASSRADSMGSGGGGSSGTGGGVSNSIAARSARAIAAVAAAEEALEGLDALGSLEAELAAARASCAALGEDVRGQASQITALMLERDRLVEAKEALRVRVEAAEAGEAWSIVRPGPSSSRY